MNFRITGGNQNANMFFGNQVQKDGVYSADFRVELQQEEVPERISIYWNIPAIDMYSVWSPTVKNNHHLGPAWRKQETGSRLASWMPIHTVLSVNGNNRITIALSDALNATSIGTGIIEEDASLECRINLFTEPSAAVSSYKVTIRIDMREMAYYDCIRDVVKWWETECGYVPAYVPEHARLPMNSLWYSYHQNLDVDDIIKECVLSKQLGMDTVIVDDGWQTDDSHRGYAFCGDWEAAQSKVPDMRAFVQRVHETGMKFILWYSVPFVGVHCKNYERFKDMLMDGTGNNVDFWALDPRYKEVREFLVDVYVKALNEWKLDGFKLDFIDSFILSGKSLEYDERRDYQSLEEAVDCLMTDVSKALRAINPEIMIEFRQSYVGPAIRKYGNMFRVADCPNDPIINRWDVTNLRLTSGNTAVHSDMLMWHYEDSVENAALQFASILYSVPQVSMKIAQLSEEHKKMLAYYLNFWRTYRDVLLDGRFFANNPEVGYSLVGAEKDGKAIYTAYTERMISCDANDETIVVNATGTEEFVCCGVLGKPYRVVNCMGEEVSQGAFVEDIVKIQIPRAGMISIFGLYMPFENT